MWHILVVVAVRFFKPAITTLECAILESDTIETFVVPPYHKTQYSNWFFRSTKKGLSIERNGRSTILPTKALNGPVDNAYIACQPEQLPRHKVFCMYAIEKSIYHLFTIDMMDKMGVATIPQGTVTINLYAHTLSLGDVSLPVTSTHFQHTINGNRINCQSTPMRYNPPPMAITCYNKTHIETMQEGDIYWDHHRILTLDQLHAHSTIHWNHRRLSPFTLDGITCDSEEGLNLACYDKDMQLVRITSQTAVHQDIQYAINGRYLMLQSAKGDHFRVPLQKGALKVLAPFVIQYQDKSTICYNEDRTLYETHGYEWRLE